MNQTTRILHIYEHCPFCVKALMIFGLKNIPFERRVFLNDDEAGPISMVGRKVVPILEENGRYMPESMDIVSHIDGIGEPLLTGPVRSEIAHWLKAGSRATYRLFLPRAVCTPLPEFATTSARAGFIRRKEESTGPFWEILADGSKEIAELNALLEKLAPLIQSPEAVNGTLSTDDIHLFAQLHSMSLIKGLRYPLEVEAYRQVMSEKSGVSLLNMFAV
ncbi:glutaredoxin 2 [Gluconobacter thailandicus]|uniref:Glutaredoxin 2 n=1 Tax=Gluconobacter thailandicus TaxID=257438 RepID=A0AAP9ERH8_GLUTH|nr:glutaredoxin 2 [Gluconobacter thailandicus]QEH95307.1 glutaredoxin 2 [Gluconobacter thailandicus]